MSETGRAVEQQLLGGDWEDADRREKKTDVFLTRTESPTCMRCSPMGELKCENEASGWKQASGWNWKQQASGFNAKKTSI